MPIRYFNGFAFSRNKAGKWIHHISRYRWWIMYKEDNTWTCAACNGEGKYVRFGALETGRTMQEAFDRFINLIEDGRY